jgi:hypothetical protein
MSTKHARFWRFVGILTGLSLAAFAHGAPIPLNTFLQFSFLDAGDPAIGCFPDDPNGELCLPGSNPPTQFLPAPPWTFAAPTGGATLIVVDAFEAGDRFEVFDFGITSLGLTSAPIGVSSCGNSPFACLVDPNISRGFFELSDGPHSITLLTALSPTGSGTGFLVVQVPEPAYLSLLALALLALFGWQKRIRND